MSEPTRNDVDAMNGLTLLEFGASWCGHCLARRAKVDALLEAHPDVVHIRVEDGPGLPLGRSFHVKLWPTFVFRRDGQTLQRLVRPSEDELERAFATLESAGE